MPKPVNRTTARAREQSCLGLSRELRTTRTEHDSEAKAGSKGVSLKKRWKVLEYAVAYSIPAAARKYDVSTRSIYRWMERAEPYQMTGNHEQQNLVGHDQFLLAMSIYLYPAMNSDKRAAFIYANGGGEAYSRQDLSKRCAELGITLKKRSIEANQAFTPTNLLKKHLFFSRGPRSGICGIWRFRLIDSDEASFSLVKIETKKGWAFKTQRVRDPGNYTRGTCGTVNLIMSVEPGNPYLPPHIRGSIQNPRKWWQINTVSTNQYVFSKYCDYILSSIEDDPLPNGYDNQRFLMWDNLSAHQTPMVSTMVQLRPSRDEFSFTPIRRPPYQPKHAPIEFIFGQIAMRLSS